MNSNAIGIIANPNSGKDIRRLVAYGSVFNNNEKISILKRILMALDALKIKNVYIMPDHFGLGVRAIDDLEISLKAHLLEMDIEGNQNDSSRAAEMLNQIGVACIITLGGDGTNRVVAKTCRETPILPISTGTNNVFPYMIEGTLAGMAAGALATNKLIIEKMCLRAPMLEVYRNGELIDIALIDMVVTDDTFIGARAVWNANSIKEVFLTQAKPASIGFSSLGGFLCPALMDSGKGLHILIGKGKVTINAPLAPGLIANIPIASHGAFGVGESIPIQNTPSVIALDGERELCVAKGEHLSVSMNPMGPLVIDIDKVLQAATEQSIFTGRQSC